MTIATEWIAATAGDLGIIKGGSGFPTRFQGRRTGQFPFYKVSDMNLVGNEVVMTTANNYISEPVRASLGSKAFPANAIVFAKVGAAVFLERKRLLSMPSCIDNNMAAFVVDARLAEPLFIYYALTNFRLGALVAVGALPSLNGTQLRSIPLLIPPTIQEQKEVVAVLSDADELIRSLERLIEKKRNIKQGIMQELLTGRTRLPGFTGDWDVRKVGDFADVRAGGTPSTAVDHYWGGDVRWMSSGEIHLKRVHEVSGRITQDGLLESAAQLLPAGTVLMALAGQGKTRGTVAVSRIQLSTNQSIAGILPSDKHDSDFLYYNLDARYEELRGESSGDGGRGGLNLTIIKKLEVWMPRVDEQRAIARVLGDVDDEVDALKACVVSARAIKQGMMQELLTGRTRLSPDGVSA